ncbi:TadE/TadG family type IV pilus assembly protein [Pseudorhodobacter sp. W20_MBD10_FR17]|uniref:TadE/TadG family type IV pilus assembly protein n=1 Tax=Pseudorhodobacter sp. W20_MBD10_FR17 TaxID=3240266 RepID=UPI003F9E01AC
MSFLKRISRRFFHDESGTILVDAVLLLPVLVWGYVGLFAYWDSYRTINTVQKASYTISDLLSRSQEVLGINDAYLSGMRTTLNTMIDTDQTSKIRVTSYKWSESNTRYEVIFSRSPDSAMTALTNTNLATMTDRLPIMSDGDSAVLLEVEVAYTPPVAYGLEPTTIKQFIVTRPRFVSKLCHVSFAC